MITTQDSRVCPVVLPKGKDNRDNPPLGCPDEQKQPETTGTTPHMSGENNPKQPTPKYPNSMPFQGTVVSAYENNPPGQKHALRHPSRCPHLSPAYGTSPTNVLKGDYMGRSRLECRLGDDTDGQNNSE